MRWLFLGLIRLYQTYVSPYKGFRCAYHAHTGGQSCSTFGYTAIRRHGARVGWLLLRRRFRKCASVKCSHKHPIKRASRLSHQAGFCDLPLDGCCDTHCDLGCHPTFHLGESCDISALDCLPCDDCGLSERLEKKLRRRKQT